MIYNFDVKQIEEDVAKVLRYSQNFCDTDLIGVPKIISDWLENKKFFIEHMNGQLVYQLKEPVSFELDEKAKREKLRRFAEEVDSHYNNWRLSQFLYSLQIEDFYNNHASEKYTYGDIVVPKNFKIVKAFKFFENNNEILKQLQSEASRIIQENIISGYLCFSVHPLDYLSLSENVHNWRSCHALDGEYRSGNLNYMVDDTTVVCYLRPEKQAILPHFPDDVLWNSKKWRVLLFFSEDKTMVFSGRPYPFVAEQGIELIRTEILPALRLGTWTKWGRPTISALRDENTNISYNFTTMIPVGNELKKFDSVVQDRHNTYQFNDLLRSSVYKPVWSYRHKTTYWDVAGTGCSNANITKVEVGRACPCPVCGLGTVSYSNMMCCPTCAEKYEFNNEDYRECEICGSMTFYDELFTLEYSNFIVCSNCYHRETVQCQECGVHDLPEMIKYHDGDSRCLCPECWQDTQQE